MGEKTRGFTSIGGGGCRGPAPWLVLAVLATGGCQGVFPGVTPSPTPRPARTTEVEPNDDFAEATVLTLQADQTAAIAATISDAGDVDVFDIGTVSPGDVVQIRVTRRSTSLEPSLALYDADGCLTDEDTLASVSDSQADPSIHHVVRAFSARLYAAITHNFVRDSVGDYELSVSVQRSGEVPASIAQVVYLNFAGGEVVDPLARMLTIPPFDAGAIDSIYVDRTAVMKAAIRKTITENYQRFQITFLTSDDDEPPAAGSYAEVVFGGYSSFAFGVANDVDLYNQDAGGTALVFTESFEPGVFLDTPSSDALAVAIGNVAAHELGHLLGLNHVNDPLDLMDEASPAYTLLWNQEFKKSSLSPLVFPLGSQDGARLLSWTLGLRPGAAETARQVLSPESAKALPAIGLDEPFTPTLTGPVCKCLTCASPRTAEFGPFLNAAKTRRPIVVGP